MINQIDFYYSGMVCFIFSHLFVSFFVCSFLNTFGECYGHIHLILTTAPLITAPCHSPARAVTMATWLTSCMAMPFDPRRVDLWPENHQRRGEACGPCMKTIKALHWLAIICPFRSPIYVIGVLTNWTFCTLLAAPSPVYPGQSVSSAGAGTRWCSLAPLFGGAREIRPDITSTSADQNQMMVLSR